MGSIEPGRVSATCGRVRPHTGNNFSEIKAVGCALASVVPFQPGRTTLKEPGRADPVAAGGVREADTDLCETLPEVAFLVGAGLPASLEHLMGSEGPPLPHQNAGRVQRVRGWQWILRDRLNAGIPVGQGSAKSITRPLLTWAPGIVSVAVAGHIGLPAESAQTMPKVIGARVRPPAEDPQLPRKMRGCRARCFPCPLLGQDFADTADHAAACNYGVTMMCEARRLR